MGADDLKGTMFKTCMVVLVCALTGARADYECACNYAVELPIYAGPTTRAAVVSYMYEFDCLPVYNGGGTTTTAGWQRIASEHQVRFIQKSQNVQVVICQGNVPIEHKVTSTPQQTTTIQSTTATPKPVMTTQTKLTSITTITSTTHTPTTITTTETTPTTQTTTTTSTTTIPTTQTTETTATTTAATTTTTTTTQTTTSPSTTAATTVRTTTPTPTTETTTQTTVMPSTTTTHSTTRSTTHIPTTELKTKTTTKSSTTTTKPSTTTTQIPQTASTTTTKRKSTTTMQPTTLKPQPSTTTTTTTTTTATTTTASTTTTTNAPTTPDIRRCPSAVRRRTTDSFFIYKHRSYCYEYRRELQSWATARQDCNNNGGVLLTIQTQEEQDFIFIMLGRLKQTQPIWLGLHDMVHEEHWQWVSDEPMTFDNWMPGRFHDKYHSFEDCAVFVPIRAGQWDDVHCTGILFSKPAKHPWICKYQLV